MALPDLHKVREFSVGESASEYDTVCWDAQCERCAYSTQGTVHIRRSDDWTELAALPGYDLVFRQLAFSPDGRLLFLACGHYADRVEIIDLERRETVLRPTGPNFCRTMDFSADSRYAAIAYDSEPDQWPIHVFDLKSGKKLASFPHGSLPYLLRFHPKQFNHLLTSDQTPSVRVWDWETGRVVHTLRHPDGVIGIDWHPDGEIIATGCADSKVRLWDAVTGEQRAVLSGHEAAPAQVAFCAGGEFLVSRGWEGVLRLWDPERPAELVSSPTGGPLYPAGRAANRFGVGNGEGGLGILEAATGQGYRLLRSGPAPAAPGRCCDLSPDGRLLVSTDGDALTLWDVPRGKQVIRISKPGSFSHARFQPDGTRLFVNGNEGLQEYLVRPDAAGEHFTLAEGRRFGPPDQGRAITLTADGGLLATASGDSLFVFDTKTGEERARLLSPERPPILGALSPDGRFAATAVRGTRPFEVGGTNVQIWDVAHSNIVRVVPGHSGVIPVFSPRNEVLIVGDILEYRAWSTRTWECLYRVPREAAFYWGFSAFSPDSRLLAVAMSRARTKLLDAATGTELATLEGPDQMQIEWFAFSGDGAQLAVLSASAVQLWDLRVIRAQLAAMNLDWESPTGPASAREKIAK